MLASFKILGEKKYQVTTYNNKKHFMGRIIVRNVQRFNHMREKAGKMITKNTTFETDR